VRRTAARIGLLTEIVMGAVLLARFPPGRPLGGRPTHSERTLRV
jgi:hypothetical protein